MPKILPPLNQLLPSFIIIGLTMWGSLSLLFTFPCCYSAPFFILLITALQLVRWLQQTDRQAVAPLCGHLVEFHFPHPAAKLNKGRLEDGPNLRPLLVNSSQ